MVLDFNRRGSSHSSTIYSASAPVAWGGLTIPPSPSTSTNVGESIQNRYSSAPPNPRIRLDSDIGSSLSAAMSQTLGKEYLK